MRAPAAGPSRRWQNDPQVVAARAKAQDALDRLDDVEHTDAFRCRAYRDLGEAMIELCPLPWPVHQVAR